MADEKGRLELLQEKEALELEELRERVARQRSEKQQKAAARADNEKSFREAAQKQAQMQAGCNHKKGGRDYAATNKRGDGDNYSVIPHTMPLGNTIVLCTRCLFMWTPGTSAKFMPDGKTKNPTGISWAEAIKLPTDNSPSGSVLFGQRPVVLDVPEAA